MREESHLDDMRSAIRGDFERLARRRGSQDLMREEGQDGGEASRAPTDTAEVMEAAGACLDPAPAADAGEVSPDPAAEAPVRRSWLDRLLGR